MTIAIYFKSTTRAITQVLQAPDLTTFPDPGPDELAVLSETTPALPGWVDEKGLPCPMPERPTAHHQINWTTRTWEDARTIQLAVNVGLDEIDRCAGQARLRYITSVPGQAETYAKKEEQARAWASAAYWGDPPSFIAAEAEALNVTPQSVAEEVIALADFWANVKGPQIEATRRKWKVSLEGAHTPSEVDSMVEAARVELDAL